MFRLVLPLPFPGLDRVNAYLLASDEGHTLVDCGIFDPAWDDGGWADLMAALSAVGARVEEVRRLVVTHHHIDHYGMAGRVVEVAGCELWMHAAAEEDLLIYEDPSGATQRLKELLVDHGVDAGEANALAAYEDWRAYVSALLRPSSSVAGGETFAAGGREWEVVPTPGHAASHICLFAPGERLLISGDHLLPSVTPHIDFRRGDEDPLGAFLASLERVERLVPDLVLPGHGRPFEDGAGRARAVARFHDRRLGSILQVIRHEERSADEITDEIFGTTLLEFQRRLALGEALAHLAYLRRRGEVARVADADGVFRYRKAGRRAPSKAEE